MPRVYSKGQNGGIYPAASGCGVQKFLGKTIYAPNSGTLGRYCPRANGNGRHNEENRFDFNPAMEADSGKYLHSRVGKKVNFLCSAE